MGNKKVAIKRKWNTAIITTVIGVIGTIVVALITVWGNRQVVPDPIVETYIVTATFMPTAIPTDTVPPGQPTSTPAPTDTPVPVPTQIPAVPIGQDWIKGCISSLWKVYPATVSVLETGDGCLLEPVYIFEANNGTLSFLDQRSGLGHVEDYGMFAPLPESGSVTVTVRLKDLDNVDIWIGVFPEADPRSDGLLLIIPEGNVRKRVIVQKDPFTYETLLSTINLDQGDGYSFTFTFTSATATGEVNPFVFKTTPKSIPTIKKWLYIGYRGMNNSYRVEGSVTNLILE